jgi:hypothetical protein
MLQYVLCPHELGANASIAVSRTPFDKQSSILEIAHIASEVLALLSEPA